MRFRSFRFYILALTAVVLVVLGTAIRVSASSSSSIQTIDDATLQAMTATIGGASPLPTTRTIPHWYGQTLDPHNGVTYGYNMVGSNPNGCSGSGCSTTIQADITPVVVNIDGRTFDGNQILPATLNSPQFASNDYGKTPYATNSTGGKGKGGTLSQGDSGVALQLED